MELEIDSARIRVFRIWAWDRVFCGLYLGTRRQESDWLGRRRRAGVDPDLHDSQLGEPWRTELESSWERVFEALSSRMNASGRPSGHEAVVEVLERRDVLSVDQFQLVRKAH